MVEVKVTIDTPAGSTSYSVMVPSEDGGTRASKALGSAVELGCALLDAPYRKDTDGGREEGLEPRTVQ
jgi:hypothetical protein